MSDIDFVDGPPAIAPKARGEGRNRRGEGPRRVRSNGRPTLITETGDRYVAPDSHRSHGTHKKYVLERCRCAPCTIASREYERARVRRREPAYVEAAPAREHVLAMMDLGCGYQLQSRVTGVPEQTYQNLLYGGWRVEAGVRTKRPPAQRLRKASADRMLTFRLEHGVQARIEAGSPRRVPAALARRQLRELLAAGWWVAAIVRATGITDRQGLDRLAAGKGRYVSATLASAIAGLQASGASPPQRRSRWPR